MGRWVSLAVVVLLGLGPGPGLAGRALATPPRRRAARLVRRIPDPTERRAEIRRITLRSDASAAHFLDEISRYDPDRGVRLDAIRALARIVADDAVDILVARLAAGGTESERAEIARALDLREGGPEALRTAVGRATGDPLARGLLIEAYASLRTHDSLAPLIAFARSSDPFVRTEALRALAQRPDGRDALLEIARLLLRKLPDGATAMVALGILYSHGVSDDLPLVRRFAKSAVAEIRRAAEAAIERIEWKRARVLRREAEKDGYGVGGDPPREPRLRPRYDLVYGIDSTGSMCADLERVASEILLEVRRLVSLGNDVRVGIVRYRDTGRAAGGWEARAQPLTHDIGQLRETFELMRGSGCNDRSASIFRCLSECYDRMGWRWDAIRHVVLVADTPVDDLAGARRVVTFHRHADGTRLDVWYALHTRSSVPKGIDALVDAGGGMLRPFGEESGRRFR